MNEFEVRDLQQRVHELEHELVEARATIAAMKDQSEQTRLLANEERWRSAIMVAPYPLMIRREDGKVLLVNNAWTEITGYALEDIPTIGEWARKAYGTRAMTTQSLILEEGFSDEGIRKWGEFEVTTRSGEVRRWDFSTAPLGVDEYGRRLVIAMAVDITDRQRAEEALKSSEAKMRAVFKAIIEGVVFLNPKREVEDVNDAVQRNYAHEVQELKDPNLNPRARIIRPDGTPFPVDEQPAMLALRTGQAVRSVELGVPMPDGTISWRLANAQPVYDEQNILIGVVASFSDITEQKRIEQELRKSQEHLRQLNLDLQQRNAEVEVERMRWQGVVEGIADEVWVSDMRGNISLINLGSVTTMGLEEFRNRSLDEVLQEVEILHSNGEPRPPEQTPLLRSLAGDILRGEEIMRHRRTGVLRYRQYSSAPTRDSKGQVTGSVVIVRDVTDFKEAEQALAASRHRISDILTSLAGGLFALNREWNIIYANQHAAEIAGRDAEELIGENIWELWPELIGTPLASYYRQAMETGVTAQFRARGYRTGRWYDVSVSPSSEGIAVFYVDRTEQVRAEEALREAEIKYRTLVEHIPNAVTYMDSPDATIGTFFVSPQIEAMLGYTVAEWQDDPRSWIKSLHPDDKDRLLASDAHHKNTGEPFSLEYRMIARDGRTVWVRDEAIMIRDASGRSQFSQGIMIDITERKRLEGALRESEEKYRTLFERMREGFEVDELIWDEQGNPVDYRVLDANPAYEMESGLSREQAIGRRAREILPLISSTWLERLAHVVHTGEPIQFEEYSYALQRWLECDVFSLHQGNQFAIVFRNITERKRVEASLRESEERFRSLADSMPQLVWTALPDGTVDYYNKRYREYRQIRKLEHSWEWAAVLHPDDLQVTLDAWQKALATGEIYQVEHRVQMVDGSYRWHLSRGIPVRDTEGRITRWYGTATDIHSLKRALQKLDVYTHRLERSNRDLQEFAYVASHDLQEPLRKIEAFGSALSETSENLSEKQQDYIDRMRNASGRMRSMVDSLLTLSRVERTAQPFTRVDLKHIASEVLSTLEMQIRSTGGEVEIGDLPHIYADPIQIHQLLQNLIGNALKFHDEGIPPQVKVHARQRPGHVELIVEDQGIGFEETDADRIFQPFQRLVGRNQYPGSGMGLAICRRIVERHGGTITAHSQPGKGSTFIVTLPIRQTDGL